MFKFCILAAGRGTRNKTIDGLHKALLPIENKAIISHIIESVPRSVEIVIPLGYKSEQIKSYVNHVFPDRKIQFVDVDNYDGEGSGPGYSLLQCEKYLQCPFIFTSVDTLIEEKDLIDLPECNWVGVSNVDADTSSSYCLVEGNDVVESFYYGSGVQAFIGMSGILDYDIFWDSLKNNTNLKNEHQVLDGFSGLDEIRMLDFTWYDLGNDEAYLKTRKELSDEVVATKNDECIFIERGKVIKYYRDSDKAKKRIDRSNNLVGCVPETYRVNENMLSYDYVEGEMFSNIKDTNVLNSIFPYYKNTFWDDSFEKTSDFTEDCKKMYIEKLYDRIQFFVDSDLDKITKINTQEVDPIMNLLDRVDWDSILDKAIPSKFHGDFQPENIIYDGSGFKLIDWRESFGLNVNVGDFYYDLGKLYHALIINGSLVLKKQYSYYVKKDGTCCLKYVTKRHLVELMPKFKSFCMDNGLDWDNVELLGILQYIGICSLYQNFHDGDYGEFLFLLGKLMLTEKLSEIDNEKDD
tara:strand:+ start:278 stop:1840 length:1563 start_codon:yes stop_codon:yes gene_type:complete